jgi:hypothetical protein
MAIQNLERMRITASRLQAELQMTRIGLMRVHMLLDQYDAVCMSLEASILLTMHTNRDRTRGASSAHTQPKHIVCQQAAIQAQVRRVLSRTGSQLQDCATTLEVLTG